MDTVFGRFTIMSSLQRMHKQNTFFNQDEAVGTRGTTLPSATYSHLQLEFSDRAGAGVACCRQMPTLTCPNPHWLLLMELLAWLFQLDF